MKTVTSIQVGFGFVYDGDSDPKTWVDLSVNGNSILISPDLARKIAGQLNDFADYVEGTDGPEDPGDGEEYEDEQVPLKVVGIETGRFSGKQLNTSNTPKS